jgi:hypothetical protein
VRRRVFTILSALSLLLSVATVVLWARSYWIHDMWSWSHSGYVSLHFVNGGVVLWWGVPNPGDRPVASSVRFIWDGLHRHWGDIHEPISQFPADRISPTMTVYWNFAGFISAADDPQRVRQSPSYHMLAFPCWFFVAIEALVIAVMVRRMAAARRYRSGLCSRCGYDIRATPDRCPECGTAMQAQKT